MSSARFVLDSIRRQSASLVCTALFFSASIAHGVDLDSDGLSDLWQQRYAAQELAGLADQDGDGHSNGAEATAGTNPFDSADYPILGPIWAEAGGQPLHLSFPTKSGKWYQLNESTNLLGFSPVGSPLVGHGSPIHLTLETSNASRSAGAVSQELWADVTGNDLSLLTGLADFPNSPDGTAQLPTFESPRVFASGFGGRMRGLVTPAASGDFTFYVSAGSAAELHLSTNATRQNLIKRAEILPAQTGIAPGVWTAHPDQRSLPITLVAGTPYLLEVRYLASVSRSHCQVGWSGPGITGIELLPASALVPAEFLPKDVPALPVFAHDYDTTGQTSTVWPFNTAIVNAPVGMSGKAERVTGDPGGMTEETETFPARASSHFYATWLINMSPGHDSLSLYFKNGPASAQEGPRIDLEERSSGTIATVQAGGANGNQAIIDITFGQTYRIEIIASLIPGGFQYGADLATLTVAEDTFDLYVTNATGDLVGSARGLTFMDGGANIVQGIDNVRMTGFVTPNLYFDAWQLTGGNIAGDGYLRGNMSSFAVQPGQHYFRLGIGDTDQDGDGLPDWEEMELAAHNPFLFFDAQTTNGTADATALTTLLNASSGPTVVSLAASDTASFESNFPNLGEDNGRITVYRTGPLTPVTVNLCQAPLANTGNTATICDGTCCTLVGSAGDEEAEAADYTLLDADGKVITNQLSFGLGEMQKVLTVKASLDSINEYPETLNMALEPDDGGSYQISATNGASIQLFDLPEHPDNVALFTGTFAQDGRAVVATQGSGFLTATINGPRTKVLLWSEFSNLTSVQQDSHVHKANPGPAPGSIIYAITNVPGEEGGSGPEADPYIGPITAYPWDLTTSSGAIPTAGGAASKQVIIDSLFAQNSEAPLYLNIHTVDNPAGEIWAFLALTGGSQVSPGAPAPAAAPGSAGYPQLFGAELEGEVRRFLNQATFGATDSEVAALVSTIETARLTNPAYHRHTAFEAWIDAQMNPAVVPQSFHLDYHFATDWQYYVLGGAFDPLRNPTIGARTTPVRPSVWPTVDRSDPNPEHWHLDLAYPITSNDLTLIGLNALTAEPGNSNRNQAYWQMMLNAKDQLRQKTGFALQQIVVVSAESAPIFNSPYGGSNYQDMLNAHAFGHYRDVLGFVNWSPIMGKWLSSLQNQKGIDLDNDGNDDISPDENLARENMQLFSIGLFELWPDGSLRLGSNGLPIPTYNNDDIQEFAKILTGQSFGRSNSTTQPWGGVAYDSMPANATFTLSQDIDGLLSMRYSYPMRMFGLYHDLSAKTFAGTTIDNTALANPDAQGVADIEAAIDWLSGKPGDGEPDFDMVHSHRSTPAFICRRLIQRIVTSNPSREYLHRVATVFKDSEGDLGLTMKAILLDPEARNVNLNNETFGLKKSPLEGYIQMVRALSAITYIPLKDPAGAYPFDAAPGSYSNADLFLDNFGYPAAQLANQSRNIRFLQHHTNSSGTDSLQMAPFRQSTVFNWYLPDYSPSGPIADSGLVAPEMQLANEPDLIRNINYFEQIIRNTNGIAVNPLGGIDTNQRLAFGSTNDVDNNDNVRLDRSALTSTFYPSTAPTAAGGRTSESLADEILVDELDRRLTCGFLKRRYPYNSADNDDPAVPGPDDLLKNPRELIIDSITIGYNNPYDGSGDESDRLNKLADALYLLTFSPEYQIKK